MWKIINTKVLHEGAYMTSTVTIRLNEDEKLIIIAIDI